MGNCYSTDHIAKDHMPTDIVCSTEEPQQMYRLGTDSNRFLGGDGSINLFFLDPNSRP